MNDEKEKPAEFPPAFLFFRYKNQGKNSYENEE